ncbi:hypothetical protein [Nocardia sp. NPDC059239]|uniref:hypothetical protein n=1 Tax=unclassified Nocardia TaxID=2637762 RepID=UPI00368D934A
MNSEETRDEIRDKAIDRLARWKYEAWRKAVNDMPPIRGCEPSPGPLSYDEAPEHDYTRRAYRREAAKTVDALGDLLPTGQELRELEDGYVGQSISATGVVTSVAKPCTRLQRYVTEWKNAV